MAALSTLKETDPSVCERFEVYIDGVEIGNCFNELRDISVQKERYLNSKKERQDLYGETIPEPKVLFKALERGNSPMQWNCSWSRATLRRPL